MALVSFARSFPVRTTSPSGVVPQQLLDGPDVRPGKQGTNSERPTLNIERRTDLPAALPLPLLGHLGAAHKNTINSSVSFTNASTERGRSRGTRWIKSNQRQDSRSSLRQNQYSQPAPFPWVRGSASGAANSATSA